MLTPRSSAPRSALPVAVVLGLVGLFCAAGVLGQLTDLSALSWLLRGGSPGAPLDRSAPTQVVISSLGVKAAVVEVGWTAEGGIATPERDPAESAGWFRHGPTPGEPGISVIVGHIDTDSRPAVFHRLAQLRPGSLIEVARADGRVARFTVDSVERFPKTAFPAERIFATTRTPGLALVTCGGAWVGGDVGYADNVIVFARSG